MKLDIALCTNEKFAIPCMVCIVSIMENNAGNDITFYVLNNGLTSATTNKFRILEETYQCKINLITKHREELPDVKFFPRFSIVSYYRFFLPDLLKDINKILYLDCDTMVRNKLDDLWNTDLNDKACAVIIDQSCDNVRFYNRLRLHYNRNYFNAGVMLMNLDYWRKHDVSKNSLEYAMKIKDLSTLCDQDALNVLIKDKVVHVSPRYNMQDSWTRPINQQDYYFGEYEIIKEAMKNPVIVHFNNTKKPWHIEKHNPWDSNPWKEEFLHYAKMHAFIGFKMQRCHSLKYRAINYIVRKLQNILYKIN